MFDTMPIYRIVLTYSTQTNLKLIFLNKAEHKEHKSVISVCVLLTTKVLMVYVNKVALV